MITVPSKDELYTNLRSFLAARLPDLKITRDSDIGVYLALFAEASFAIHYNVRAVEDDLFVSNRTSTEALDQHALARLGGRKGKTKAAGINAVQCAKTSTVIIPEGTVLAYSDGTRYTTTVGDATADTTVTISIEAIEGGVAGNREIDDELTFESPPSGVTATATVIAAITGGEDVESDGAVIQRLLDAYANPPGTGRFSDWRQWATAVDGVASAYVYGPSSYAIDGRRGLGAVDVAILKSGSGENRIPSTTIRDAVEDAIDLRRPVAARDFQVLLPTTLEQNIWVSVLPKPGYEYDWEWGVSGTPLADDWNAGQKRLTWSRDLDEGEIAVGDRLIIGTTGEIGTVAALGADYTDLTDTFVEDPTGGTIYPAGPLTQSSIDAITALFDNLGPAKGDAADPFQDWEDTLRLNRLRYAVLAVEGVLDLTTNTPVANVTPTDDGVDVELLIPGLILVTPS